MSTTSIYQNVPPDQRLALLKKDKYITQHKAFSRELTQPELQEQRNAYIENQMRIKAMESELEDFVTKKKNAIKAIIKANEVKLEMIATRTKACQEDCYGIRDIANGEMLFYDKFGTLVDQRGLMPEEYQATMFKQIDGNIEKVDPPAEKEEVNGESLEGKTDEEIDKELTEENKASDTPAKKKRTRKAAKATKDQSDEAPFLDTEIELPEEQNGLEGEEIEESYESKGFSLEEDEMPDVEAPVKKKRIRKK